MPRKYLSIEYIWMLKNNYHMDCHSITPILILNGIFIYTLLHFNSMWYNYQKLHFAE